MAQIGRFSLHLLLSGACCAQVRAATPVCGVVSGHWTKANSPYVATCDLLVADLTIDPGVEVVFAGNYVCEVAGTLAAVGAPAEQIRFTCTNAAVGWQGIFFNGNQPGSELGFCWIEGSKNSGVRITNTIADVHDCTFTANSASHGGGLCFSGASGLSLSNCVFAANKASLEGGGLYVTGAGDVSLVNCDFVQNLVSSSGGSNRGGGASFAGTGLVVMQQCQFTSNHVSGAGSSSGGAGALFSKHVTADNCDFVGNSVYGGASADISLWGAGLGAVPGSNVRLFNTRFIFNWITAEQGYSLRTTTLSGSALTCNNGLVLKNCLVASNFFYANRAFTARGAIYVGNYGGSVLLHNNTIAYNSHQGFHLYQGPVGVVDIRNCIFWKNYGGGTQINGMSGIPVNYCDVEGGYPGTSNINVNPALDPATLAIVSPSPCIDAGDSDPAFNDACLRPPMGGLGTLRNDMGKDGGPGDCGLIPQPPSIVSQPRNHWSCLEHSASFTVSAAGTPPLSYQWYFNTNSLEGETGATLTLTNLHSSQAGHYWVAVWNDSGSTSSTAATLTVNDACVALALFPGLTIEGVVGQTYGVQYRTSFNGTNGWIGLTNLVLTAPSVLWQDSQPARGCGACDSGSVAPPQRFFRVVAGPIPVP